MSDDPRTPNELVSRRHQKVSGGNSGGATPDPIPNSEVKPSRADGTAGGTLWESRSSPGNNSKMAGRIQMVLPAFSFSGARSSGAPIDRRAAGLLLGPIEHGQLAAEAI